MRGQIRLQRDTVSKYTKIGKELSGEVPHSKRPCFSHLSSLREGGVAELCPQSLSVWLILSKVLGKKCTKCGRNVYIPDVPASAE